MLLPLDRAVWMEPPHGWRSVGWVLGLASLVVRLPLNRAIGVMPPHGWRSVWWVLELAIGIPPPKRAYF